MMHKETGQTLKLYRFLLIEDRILYSSRKAVDVYTIWLVNNFSMFDDDKKLHPFVELHSIEDALNQIQLGFHRLALQEVKMHLKI
ncbi:hypothetical protein H6784_04160 [Candidatus Nomurabacteria bacterium]|nr:hypothetical protein [Candidatus Kaiserbacteria bacterium]MCB9814581.1 hypothetical protein [Candidatus Nomurabacteria bacterium]